MNTDTIVADLHCHTKLSDGSVGIDELVILAKNLGLSAIAVTDHDTFAGATRAKIFGDRRGMEVIPGVEFSAYDNERKRKVHILCYLCENPDRLEGVCKRIGDSRKKAANLSVQKLLHLYPIPVDMILRRAQGSTNIFRQHIMHALIDAGYTGEIFGSLFQKLFSPRGGLIYSPVEYPEVRELLPQIHEAGGVAVLAHPAQYDSSDLLLELAEKGQLDGVELLHPSASESQLKEFSEIAAKYNLLTTGGTDFHGMYTNDPYHLGTFTVGKPSLDALRKRKKIILSRYGK